MLGIFDQLYAILKKKVKNAAQHQRRKAEMMNKDSEPKGKRQKHEVDQDSGDHHVVEVIQLVDICKYNKELLLFVAEQVVVTVL